MRSHQYFRATYRIIAIIGLLFILTEAGAQDAYHYSTRIYKTIGGNDLRLDVFAPARATALSTVIVLFHGGSWVSGDRSQLHWQCNYFAMHGMIAVTADYRLLGKDTGRKDICITDARSAVRWVKKHATELRADTNRIIVGGASAGGHLATMAILNSSLNDAQDSSDAPVTAAALVLFNPAYNVSGAAAVQPFAFPKDAIPSTIMFFGSKDRWKPAADSLSRQLTSHKHPHETWIADGEVHGFFNKAPWNLATCELALNFLQRQGIVKGNGEYRGQQLLRKQTGNDFAGFGR